MTLNFAELKRSRNKDLEKLTQEAFKLNNKDEGKRSYEDNRFWKPVVDKAGNGFAVFRFLPKIEEGDLPWVQFFSHSFQGPTGQWYIENSLTTLNRTDPVSEHNSMLWNTGIDSDKDIARKQKRKLSYIANIYMIKDPSNPDNEGKVFLYKFGKKVFDKINDIMYPEFQDETRINPFDFWEGANFKLKIRKVEGYQNYDKSEFDKVGPLSEDEDELERIWKSEYNLKEFLEEKNFKSYDELKLKLNKVLNIVEDPIRTTSPSIRSTESELPKPAAKKIKTVEETSSWDNDEENLSYFEKLAED